MADAIVNKVAESGLVTVDLEAYYPKAEIRLFDLKDYLFKGLILKEKDFRDALKTADWESYRDKLVGIVCTVDAIIPAWAYMLVTSYLQPVATDVMVGDEKEVHKASFLKNLQQMDPGNYSGQRIV